MRDLGLRVDVDGIGNIVGTWPADRHEPPVLTGSHIDTVATGGMLRRQARRARRARGASRRSIAAGVETRAPARGRRSSPTRRAAASRPTCSAASCTSGGCALEDALDTVAIDGAVLGDELRAHRVRGPVAVSGDAAARVRRAAHRAGPGARSRGRRRSARSPACRASRGPSSPITGQSNHAGTTPMDHAPRRRATSPPRSRSACARWPRSWVRRMVATVGRIELHPNLVNVVAARADAHRRPAPHRRRPCSRPPKPRCAAFCDELARARGRDHRRPRRWRASSRSSSTTAWSIWSRRSRSAQGRSTRRMPSGAGHDAQMLARVCPAGMVFVPSARRHQPQPGRAHRRRPISRPAPTCCCT